MIVDILFDAFERLSILHGQPRPASFVGIIPLALKYLALPLMET
ncbi:MAG: hypothetical protein P8Q19_00895 [Planktomarina sp.]|nr:hypothetical protein [Planktomarina sp.]